MDGVITATEFKAKCLDLLDRVGTQELPRLEITKRGKVVAVLVPPQPSAADIAGLHGCLRGSVVVPEGFDLTAPVLAESLDAEAGLLHR